jgi:DNA-binding transcriptional regulator YhcF (GntR family)
VGCDEDALAKGERIHQSIWEDIVVGKKRRKTGLQFVQLWHWVLKTPAYRHMSPGAKAAYVQIRMVYNGSNNGALGLSIRILASDLNMSPAAAARFLTELEEHGFVIRQRQSSFNQKRLATEWALTEVRNDVTSELPSKAFLRWQPSGVKQQASAVPSRKPPGPGPALAQPRRSAASATAVGRGNANIRPTIGFTPLLPSFEKKPVSKRDQIVSPTALKPISMAPTDMFSLRDETEAVATKALQSHPRDTYTSEPEGGRTDRRFQLLLSRVKDSVVRLAHDDQVREWNTPIAIGVSSVLMKRLGKDPLSRAVVDTFPGSSVIVRDEDIDEAVASYLRDRPRDTDDEGTDASEVLPVGEGFQGD